VAKPTTDVKIKKSKLFEETPTPIKKYKKVSLPTQRTTRSMSKQAIVPNIPSLQGEPMDIPSSPERGSVCGVTTICETKGLVKETLRDLRK
jgi:hypothetical protein